MNIAHSTGSVPGRTGSTNLLHPRHWHTWLGLGIFRALHALPHPLQRKLFQSLGRFCGRFSSSWSRVARANIDLCFPQMSVGERSALLRRHFESLGLGIYEMGNAFWASNSYIERVTEIVGLEHLQSALSRGRGVIVVGAHFTTIEFATRVLGTLGPINVLYRETKNPVLAKFLVSNTAKLARRAIPHTAIREVINALRANEAVWYAPDQSYRNKGAALVPFFGIPAASATLTSRLSRISGASVVTYFPERLANGRYRMTFGQSAVDGSNDPLSDVEKYHHEIEAHVRRIPDQYLWIHRRFKGLAENYPNYYGRDARQRLTTSQV